MLTDYLIKCWQVIFVDSIELAPATFLAVFSQVNVSGQCGPARGVDDSLGAIEGGNGGMGWQTGGGLGGKVRFYSRLFLLRLLLPAPKTNAHLR